MTSFERVMTREGIEFLDPGAVERSWIVPVWIIGLISTVYLVGYASLLIFLAVVFASSPSSITSWEYVGYIGMDSIPACCYVAIGVAGLTLLPSRRFRILGLSAISVETALAIYAFANPGSLPPFTDWLV